MFASFPRAVALSACAAFASAPAGAQTARDSLDWRGVYYAAPCETCQSGTWLALRPLGRHASYELSEDANLTRGPARWRPDGLRLNLSGEEAPRAVFVSEGHVMLADDGEVGPQLGLRLARQHEFRNAGERLYVEPTSVAVDNGLARFRGLHDYAQRQSDGRLSLTATFEIDCARGAFRKPDAVYHAGRLATGRVIHRAEATDLRWRRIAGPRDVMARAAERYCP